MALTINTEMTDLGVKPGYYAGRPLAEVIEAHAMATRCAADAAEMLTTNDGFVLDLDAWRCALLMQRVAAAELTIRGCSVGYNAEGSALVTEPQDGAYPVTSTDPTKGRRLYRVYLRGMTSTDVLVEATSEKEARKAAYRAANEDSFDWGGVEVDTSSTEAEELDERDELSDDERARVIEVGR
jgi:hypothetical protein